MSKIYKIIAFAIATILISTSCDDINDIIKNPDQTENLGTEESPYEISTADQLRKLSADVNAGTSFTGEYFIITNDIDLGGKDDEFTAIGTKDTPFSGTLDGGGHCVSGLYINQPELNNQGLFGCISDATIKNLGVDGEVTAGSSVGGIVGWARSSVITKCYNSASVTNWYYDAGGIAGDANCFSNDGEEVDDDTAYISFCYNTGNVSKKEWDGDTCGGYIGGIVGGGGKITIHDCHNEGTITDSKIVNVDGGTLQYTGGICGSTEGPLYNCYNSGKVIGHFQAGGICGWSELQSHIYNCYNTGDISSDNSAGGILGSIYGFDCECYSNVHECYNNGTITVQYSNTMQVNRLNAGGIVGGCYPETGLVAIENCYNTGRITFADVAEDQIILRGGILAIPGGSGEARIEISNCYNIGDIPDIDSNNQVYNGSIVPLSVDYCFISNCYFNSGSAYAYPNDENLVNVELKSDEEMKSKEFVALLNANQNENPWASDILNTNNHYPILSWQE